jgi:hypothetical protein
MMLTCNKMEDEGTGKQMEVSTDRLKVNVSTTSLCCEGRGETDC